MIRQHVENEIAAIKEGLRDFPANLILLALAALRALLEDTQVQLLAILGGTIGVLFNWRVGIVTFLASYSFSFYITSILNALLKMIAHSKGNS